MRNLRHMPFLLPMLAIFLALAGCGKDDSGKTSGTQAKSAPPAAEKSADGLNHKAFEAKYADMCVKQELALRKQEHPNSGNAGVADATLSDLCACIAKEESKRLTKQEARKFVEQNEYPMSLMIKAGQAEEVCAKK